VTTPSSISAPPSLEQLYAMLGQLHAENTMLKVIIAQHPEIIAAHNVEAQPAVLSGEVLPPDAPDEGA
jgi:hypothetical protein